MDRRRQRNPWLHALPLMNSRGGGLCLSVCSWVWITGLFIILIKALLLLLLLLLMVNHWICFYHSSPVYSLPGPLCYRPCNSNGYENNSPIKYHHHPHRHPLRSLSNPHPLLCIGIHPRHSNHHPQSRLWGWWCDRQHRNAIIITIRGLVVGPAPFIRHHHHRQEWINIIDLNPSGVRINFTNRRLLRFDTEPTNNSLKWTTSSSHTAVLAPRTEVCSIIIIPASPTETNPPPHRTFHPAQHNSRESNSCSRHGICRPRVCFAVVVTPSSCLINS